MIVKTDCETDGSYAALIRSGWRSAVVHLEDENLEEEREEDVPRLPHDAHSARFLQLQGHRQPSLRCKH